MPSSAMRTYTEPDAYFEGIRNLQVDGTITQRGKFHAEATRIDLHRLWMHRFDEKLPRIVRVTPSGSWSLIPFPTASGRVTQSNGVGSSQAQNSACIGHSDAARPTGIDELSQWDNPNYVQDGRHT